MDAMHAIVPYSDSKAREQARCKKDICEHEHTHKNTLIEHHTNKKNMYTHERNKMYKQNTQVHHIHRHNQNTSRPRRSPQFCGRYHKTTIRNFFFFYKSWLRFSFTFMLGLISLFWLAFQKIDSFDWNSELEANFLVPTVTGHRWRSGKAQLQQNVHSHARAHTI